MRAERHTNGQTSIKEQLFISSTDGSAHTLGQVVRGHWGVENNVHSELDVVWREDDSGMLLNKGPENLAVLRGIALNLVRHDQTSKKSLKMRRFHASLDPDYVLQLLAGGLMTDPSSNPTGAA